MITSVRWGKVLAMGLGCVLALSTTAIAAPRPYGNLVDAYFEDLFKTYPAFATYAGIHTYDAQLEDIAPAAHAATRARLVNYLKEFEALDETVLTPEERNDREMVIADIRGRLLEEETLQMWRKNPDYGGRVTSSIFTLIKRDFAPLSARMDSVIRREEQIPKVLTEARTLLSNPPRVYTEVAIQQMPGIIDFFKQDVPEAFKSVKDPVLRKRFTRSNRNTIAALKSYQTFLKKELLLRSRSSFAIGADNYRRKLAYEEMVEIPLERLLEIGYAQLRKDQEAFVRAGAQIDPAKKPLEVLAVLEKDHPSASELIPSAQKLLDGMRQFLIDRDIITVPSTVQAKVVETPPFARALTFASMDTPGPYETRATEAYYNITLPDPRWTKAKQEEYLRGYNYPLISTVSVHEVWPGHYEQFLWVKDNPKLSKVRKLLSAGSNAEGWAHYTEQMMLDEGYGNNDPKLRMGQLIDALLRDCRYIVGIQMHTRGMSVDQAVNFFMREGYQVRPNAEAEAKRGTQDPTYLVYTLGKLSILKLREDYKQKMGDQYSLKDFHDRFVQSGAPPIKILRRELLGEDGPVL